MLFVVMTTECVMAKSYKFSAVNSYCSTM